MNYRKALMLYALLLTVSCVTTPEKPPKLSEGITESIIHDKESFFYIDFENYPFNDPELPIGVFDSGTGGLTVLKAIVNYDQYQNDSHQKGPDGLPDFSREVFTYLGDQANMPYGNYANEGKLGLLKEHIIKDAQFLMGRQYYSDRDDRTVNTGKKPIKVLVIACNTATAFGKEHIESFISQAGIDVKVIGVIDAGVRAVLESIQKQEDAIIGVLATVGTVSSKGYRNTIFSFAKQFGYTGSIEVFSQGGIGIAEAVDEDPDYYNSHLNNPRMGYKGPALDGQLSIEKSLLDTYNFDFTGNRMLCDADKVDDCAVLQINDPENYVRYHLVTLLEKIRQSKTRNTLKSIILGCTHYPYMIKEIRQVLNELYHFKTAEGQYPYKELMAPQITLIDPAVHTAKELYDYLNEKEMFNQHGRLQDSEFYISVPNQDNPQNVIAEDGRFTYDYKYGRDQGQLQEYVKRVPFSRKNISTPILDRFHKQIPHVYRLMQLFNENSEKTNALNEQDKI